MAGSFEQRQNEVGHAPFEHAATPFWPKPTPHVDVFAFADSLLSCSASGFVQVALCRVERYSQSSLIFHFPSNFVKNRSSITVDPSRSSRVLAWRLSSCQNPYRNRPGDEEKGPGNMRNGIEGESGDYLAFGP